MKAKIILIVLMQIATAGAWAQSREHTLILDVPGWRLEGVTTGDRLVLSCEGRDVAAEVISASGDFVRLRFFTTTSEAICAISEL